MSAYDSWPHGLCECRTGCQCEGRPGPAARRVTRSDGRALKVCTRCTLPGDVNQALLVTRDDRVGPLEEYDALGAFSILIDLAAAEVAS